MKKIIFSFIFFVFNIHSGLYESTPESESDDDFVETSRPWNDDGGRLFRKEPMPKTTYPDLNEKLRNSEKKTEELRKDIRDTIKELRKNNED